MRPLMPPVQTPDNLFHDGNPLTGELGTIVDAEHLNNVQGAVRDAQSELIAVLTAAGINVDPSKQNQLLTALKALLLSRSAPFADIKSDGAAAIATALSNLRLERFKQTDIETQVRSPDGQQFLVVDDIKWGCRIEGVGPLALGLDYGGTGAKNALDALENFGIGPIASAAEVTSGKAKKLVDAQRLIGAIATDADIQNKVARKFVDAYGLINAITTMQDVQDGALRKFVNALTLKNYLPVKALSANGFIRIPDVPGGTIIQYGQVSKSISEGIQNVTLPTPFPNLCRFAIAIPLNQNSDTTVDIFAQLQSLSQTGINFFFSWASSSSPATGFQWFALGY